MGLALEDHVVPACLPYMNQSSAVSGRVIELPLAVVVPIAEGVAAKKI